MPAAVFILASAAFVIGTQSYVFAGLLAELAADLGVSVAAAGQLITAFAVTSAVASPLVVSLVARFERKRVLLLSLAGVALINLGTASLPAFEALLLMRILVAIIGASVMPVAGAIAADLVKPHEQGRALGLVLSGITLAAPIR